MFVLFTKAHRQLDLEQELVFSNEHELGKSVHANANNVPIRSIRYFDFTHHSHVHNTNYTHNILRGKGALLIFLLYIQRMLVLCFILFRMQLHLLRLTLNRKLKKKNQTCL